jgi:uncharacterized protein
VTVHRPRGVEEFLRRAGDLLLAAEAENNLIIGICDQIKRGLYGRDPYFAVLRDGVEISGAALRTPPNKLLLSHRFPRAGLTPLAADVAEEYEHITGVLADSAVSQEFARTWTDLTGQAHRIGIRMRIFRADSVSPPADVPGRFRRASPQDRALLKVWIAAFLKEGLGQESNAEDVERSLDNALKFEAGGLFVWEHMQPVSMAGYEGPTPNGVRVNAVYTPPDRRRRGYASACVAQLTQTLFDGGRSFCFLFTDLANATSNRIYQRIGYRPVCDVDEYLFGDTS